MVGNRGTVLAVHRLFVCLRVLFLFVNGIVRMIVVYRAGGNGCGDQKIMTTIGTLHSYRKIREYSQEKRRKAMRLESRARQVRGGLRLQKKKSFDYAGVDSLMVLINEDGFSFYI